MRRLIALLPLVFVMACSSPPVNEGNEKDKFGRNAEDAAKYAAAVKERRLLPGMHKAEIREVMGGGPEKTRKVTRGNGITYIMWIYNSRSLDLYLDTDGYLMRWTGIG